MNAFRQLLQAAGQHTPIGTWIMSASPIVAEAVGHAGFDWGVIDMEHSPLDVMQVAQMLQALSATKLVPVVRVPWNDPVMVKRVLDAGATTVLFPFVQTPEEARRAVASTRYPPEGNRGLAGMSRATKFGTTANYARTANDAMSVIVQLETPEAVRSLESIAAVPGVDAIFLGPGDLSAAMGHVGQSTHPDVMELMGRAAQRGRAIGKPVGTVGGTPEVVAQYRAAGFDYVAIASDLGLLMRSAQAAIGALRAQDAGGVAQSTAAGTRTNESGY